MTLLEIFGELIASAIVILFNVEVHKTKTLTFQEINDISSVIFQAAAWLGIALCVPCLVSTSCFAPDSPRFLLYRNDKTGCVDSLQWLRGNLSDLAGEFLQISSRLENAYGSRSLIKSIRRRAVYVPVLLCVIIIGLSSLSCLQNFSLLLITNFTGQSLSVNMVLVEISIKITGCVVALILNHKIGVKMLLLLGKIVSKTHFISIFLFRICLIISSLFIPGNSVTFNQCWD